MPENLLRLRRFSSTCTLFCFVLLPVFLFAHATPTNQAGSTHRSKKGDRMLQLTSSSFPAEGNIPVQFTCQGEDISPELSWKNAPSATKTFALIVHDPDAPRSGGFTHWVAYNIPAKVDKIPQGTSKGNQLTGGGIQGRNDSGKTGYMGPCPPSGTHRYYFYLYALDTELNLQPGATKDDLEKAMNGHVLQKAELMGKYKKGSEKAA
jgi:Raf kinase inhibitor-like YbhB/YbcL family protein